MKTNIAEQIMRLERMASDGSITSVGWRSEFRAAAGALKKQHAEIESLRHELSDERRKIGALLKEQIDDRAEIDRLADRLYGG